MIASAGQDKAHHERTVILDKKLDDELTSVRIEAESKELEARMALVDDEVAWLTDIPSVLIIKP